MANNRSTTAGTAARHEIAAIFAKAVLRLISDGTNREEIAQIDDNKLDKEREPRFIKLTSKHGG